MKPGKTGLKRIIDAFFYSIKGYRFAWQNEAAFRQEVTLACVLIPLGLWLGQSNVERALLVASVLLLIMVELLNSAIEACIDRIGPEQNPLSGSAKDMGSGAVLIANIILVSTWLLILLT